MAALAAGDHTVTVTGDCGASLCSERISVSTQDVAHTVRID